MPAWSLGKAARSRSSIKRIESAEHAGKEREPGPGAYGAPQFEKYKRAYPSWKIGTSKRNGSMRNLADAVPGPGAYKPKIDV